MSAQHTPGRLRADGTLVFFSNNAGGFDIGRCPSPEENARRLVACWNACEGLSTEALERLGTLDKARVELDAIRTQAIAQRDELLALAWKMRCAKGEVALNAAISELKRELHHTLEAALKPDGEWVSFPGGRLYQITPPAQTPVPHGWWIVQSTPEKLNMWPTSEGQLLRIAAPPAHTPVSVLVDFPQIGTAGPLPVVDGRVSLPDAAMQDLVRMLAPTFRAAQQEGGAA